MENLENKQNSQIQSSDTSSKFLWLIVGIGVLALIAAIFFYFNSNGAIVGNSPQENTEENAASIEVALQEATARLTALQTKMETGVVSQDMVDEVGDIRADLELAYENASSEVKEMWREFDQELEQFEQGLRIQLNQSF